MIALFRSGFLGAILFSISLSSQGALITDSNGNAATTLTDGTVGAFATTILPELSAEAPFDAGCGNTALSQNCSTSWTHVFGAIADPILSATLTFGIYDHQSAQAGDQVASFSVDGTDLTAAANSAFNGSGGALEEYNVYSLNLGAGLFAALVDGSATVALALQGPSQIRCLVFLPGCPSTGIADSAVNAATLIFSTIEITTQDPGTPAPAPSSLLLLGLGVFLMSRFKRVEPH